MDSEEAKENLSKISIGIRLSTMLLDHVFMTLAAFIIIAPSFILSFAKEMNVTHEQGVQNLTHLNFYIAFFAFSVYFCKDCISGRSIAKRLLKLQVVNNKTGEPASPIRCLIRDIFIIIWPIEAIVALANPSRRIGDMVAGTKLIVFDKTQVKPRPKLIPILLSLAISYGIMWGIMFTIGGFSLKNFSDVHKIDYVESSYNASESKEMEKLFTDSLGNILTPSVKVYDRIQDKNLKYVSVIFKLSTNYLSNDGAYRKIQSLTIPLLYTKFPAKTFIGQVKYYYKSSGNFELRSFMLDTNDCRNDYMH